MTRTSDPTGDPGAAVPGERAQGHADLVGRAEAAEAAEAQALLAAAVQDRRAATSEQLFRMLVASVRDYAIFLLDPRGHVATWNIGAQRIKGYRSDEIVGRHFSIFYPAAEAQSGKCEYELEVAAREGRFEDEGWRVRKDGSQFWANVVISAVRDAQGVLIGFSKVTRDLTDRRRADDERAARVAAEHANRAKDEFLAILGHELRNPLAPIVTALQLMKLRGEGPSREQQVIERQVSHMMRLIDDLLDVSRIVQGKVELKSARLDLREVVAKAIEIASPLIEQREHHLAVDIADSPPVVMGDEARLTQVFANLLVNAAKYTDPGGDITVTMQVRGNNLAVEVRDTGVGMEPSLLARVFDLFVQGYEGAARSRGGLGIGLALVRTLVEMHGGKVTARSDGVGRGSAFTVQLPCAEVHTSAAAPAAARPIHPLRRGRRVLVVDDNEDGLVLLGDALAAAGHDVRTALDPPAALAIAREFHPEVAILDIGLPGMDGYELAARMREELGDTPIQLVALTGYGQESDRARSARAGFAVHFVKPVDLRRLTELIGHREA